jgi:hypothetical protein
MSNKKQILDVDFIGGQGTLTLSEEKALSEYFYKKKSKISNKTIKPKPLGNRRKLATI